MNQVDILPEKPDGQQMMTNISTIWPVVLLLHFTMSSSRLETSAGLSALATVKVI